MICLFRSLLLFSTTWTVLDHLFHPMSSALITRKKQTALLLTIQFGKKSAFGREMFRQKKVFGQMLPNTIHLWIYGRLIVFFTENQKSLCCHAHLRPKVAFKIVFFTENQKILPILLTICTAFAIKYVFKMLIFTEYC